MGDSESIRVLIVDDHNMVRMGLVAFLKNRLGFEIVGEARHGQEALELCQRLKPDVVLMDLVMPVLGGVAATRLIRQRFRDTQVIALTSFKDQELVKDALQAGAIGYLLKDISGDELAEAIRSAHAGHPVLAVEALQALVQPLPEEDRLGKDLTRREQEVLRLLVKGMSNPEIAERLCTSRATVKVQVSSILSKLGVAHRAEAISLAIQHGLVD